MGRAGGVLPVHAGQGTWGLEGFQGLGRAWGAQVVRCQPLQLPVHAEQQLLAEAEPTTELHSLVMMALPPPLLPLTM